MQKTRSDIVSTGWRVDGVEASANARTWRWPRARLASLQDHLFALAIGLATLALYVATLLPGIGSRDTAEFQRVVPTLGLAHPTGYPLYTLLGWLWSHLPIGGTPAWRMNLFSAVAAALAIATVFYVARYLGQPPVVAAGGALALAASATFWSQATIAEVYGLAAFIEALLLLALLRWRAGSWPLWSVGLLLGLGLAHHRTIVLIIPGAFLFVVLSHRAHREDRSELISSAISMASVAWKDLAAALLALAAGCVLYLYIPLRAPAWMTNWRQVWQHASGVALTAIWFDPARLRAEGGARVFDLARRFIWPQLLPAGAVLALLGAVRLMWRDRAAAGLLLAGYGLVVAFCCAYYVADVEVFFIPAHLIAALLLGEGAMLVIGLIDSTHARRKTKDQGSRRDHSSFVVRLSSPLSLVLLAIPALLVVKNEAGIRALNRPDAEIAARDIIAQPLPSAALVVGDWLSTEGPRYLQAVEELRPDLEFVDNVGRREIDDALARDRAVYLVNFDARLGLAQWPEGRLWRVSREPAAPATATDIRWDTGIALAGYTLHPGPYRPGDPVPLLLRWEAHGARDQDYTLFIHLVGEDGTIWGQHDQPPAAAPTSRWRPGDNAIDMACATLQADAPPGRYRVNIGWYAYPSLRRLVLVGDAGETGADYLTLGEIEVVPAP